MIHNHAFIRQVITSLSATFGFVIRSNASTLEFEATGGSVAPPHGEAATQGAQTSAHECSDIDFNHIGAWVNGNYVPGFGREQEVFDHQVRQDTNLMWVESSNEITHV